MFKKNFLLILLLLLPSFDCYASFWNDVGECFDNPCNCGQGKRTETWPVGSSNSKDANSFDRNTLCPPWNKEDGRDNNCLLQFSYPSFTGYYARYCAEKTLDSSYFNPKVRIRTQTCNAVACWTLSTSLNWNGECMVWPGPYSLPLKRLCARVALPLTPANPLVPGSTDIPADPGYTPGVHLDIDGSTKLDKPIYGVDGQAINFNPPKLCVYSDPGLVNIVSDTGPHKDPLDWNPVSQPLHQTNALHPITRVLIFFIDHTGGSAMTSMIDMLLDALSGSVKGLDVFKSIFDYISIVFTMDAKIAKFMLETFGTINGSVDSDQFGCVEIPMGPYPPPYCSPIDASPPMATIQTICKIDPQGEGGKTREKSTSDSPCVNSIFDNNFISNSIRITLDNFIPICSNGEDTKTTDKCILFHNIDLNSAKAFHTNSAFTDLIKPCSNDGSCTGDIPCVCTKLVPKSCTASINNSSGINYSCGEGFRIVYASTYNTIDPKNSNQATYIPKPTGYFFDGLNDCSNTTNGSCQKIWGINTGSFIDVNLTFPIADKNPATEPLIANNLTIKDYVDTTRTFKVLIVRTPTPQNNLTGNSSDIEGATNFTQAPNQICAYEGLSDSSNIIIGCDLRETPTKPLLYNCDAPNKPPGLFCTNTNTIQGYFTPQFIAVMNAGPPGPSGVGTNVTGVVVEPCSVYNTHCLAPKSNVINSTVNLAGYNFSSFVTDDNYNVKPFPALPPLNPSSIYGKYKNDAAPYKDDHSPNPDAVYLNGLEYVNDKYIQGGTLACLEPQSLTHCPINVKNCVLTKLLNTDIVDCKVFAGKAAQYYNLALCNSASTGCNEVDSISGTNGQITIKKCDNGIFCYSSSSNAEVCKLSMNASDRVDPAASTIVTLNDDQYYNLQLTPADKELSKTYNPTDPFNQSLYGIRDKTAIEFGLCVGIKQPVCPAITNPGSNDGYATWPETVVGTEASGECIQGYAPITPLKRYCLAHAELQTVAFESLDTKVGCKPANITLVSTTHDIPSPYTFNEYEGGVEFSNYGLSQRSTAYSSTLVFNIPAVTNLQYFRITSIGYDDYVLVKVNQKWAYSGRGDRGPVYFGDFNPVYYLSDTNKFWRDDNGVDLMPYLQNGDNVIQINLIVVGGGGLYYKIEYQVKN